MPEGRLAMPATTGADRCPPFRFFLDDWHSRYDFPSGPPPAFQQNLPGLCVTPATRHHDVRTGSLHRRKIPDASPDGLRSTMRVENLKVCQLVTLLENRCLMLQRLFRRPVTQVLLILGLESVDR